MVQVDLALDNVRFCFNYFFGRHKNGHGPDDYCSINLNSREIEESSPILKKTVDTPVKKREHY